MAGKGSDYRLRDRLPDVKLIRDLAERVSRDRILKRRLPKQFGAREIYVSPDSALGFWKRDVTAIAPELFELAAQLVSAGDTIWDIGANVGLFSFAAATRAGGRGNVFALEPDPWLGMLLRRSAATSLVDAARVQIIGAAAADRVGILEFNLARRGRSSNFVSGFGATQSGGARATFPVISVTLDWLAEQFGLPDIVKIDVEGMDHLVLRGAANVLAAKPTLIMEVTSRNNEEIFRLLTSHRYRLLDADSRATISAPELLPSNIVALPA